MLEHDNARDIDAAGARAHLRADVARLPGETLAGMFAAVCCVPASYSEQPWRIAWTRHGTEAFTTCVGVLGEDAAAWREATAIALLSSSAAMRAVRPAEPLLSRGRSFDPTSAWLPLALQSRITACRTDAHWGRIARALDVPRGYRIEAALAIGGLRRVSGQPRLN